MSRQQQQVEVITPTLPRTARGSFVILVDGLFSAEEVKEWIEISERTGYSPALINIGNGRQRLMTDVRNNMRCIIDDHEWAQRIFERVKAHIPERWEGLEVAGVNERLRFLRYDPGEKFEPHYDGCYQRDDGSERSQLTILIYLNDDYTGGQTTFLSERGEGDDLVCDVKVGRVLLMEHPILHEGRTPTTGRKYVLRSDIMYRRPKWV
eukprot:TRINITY_DN2715_c0_g1_i9.p1 TRINITY_DN2715_c0_g1~~TRINITY_DN2715_c0_g1_i9.p1  ORF type:complete len:208 (-),score=22.66 TRINITY_DN2715_c0_g1_i9:127-750(-)